MDTPTKAISLYAVNLQYESMPATTKLSVIQHLIDSFACALGALDSRPAHVARTIARTATSSTGSSVFCSKDKTTPEYAAFANTILIRYLDYNDTGIGGHPSDTIPAIMALAEPMHRNGREVIRAIHASYEVFAALRVGGLYGNTLRNKHVDQVMNVIAAVVRGWHHVGFKFESNGKCDINRIDAQHSSQGHKNW